MQKVQVVREKVTHFILWILTLKTYSATSCILQVNGYSISPKRALQMYRGLPISIRQTLEMIIIIIG